MPLYGNELGRDVNPYEANLGRVVKLDKGEFVGRAALAAVQQAGPARKLVGLVMRDNAIARHGYAVMVDGDGGRRRHQRHRLADARRADRDGLPARRVPHRSAARSRSWCASARIGPSR